MCQRSVAFSGLQLVVDVEDEVSRFIPVFSSKLEAGRKLSLLKRDALVAIFKGKVEHDGLALSGLLLQPHASNGNVANHVRSRSLSPLRQRCRAPIL